MKTSGDAQHTAIDMKAKFTPAKVINIGIRHHLSLNFYCGLSTWIVSGKFQRRLQIKTTYEEEDKTGISDDYLRDG